MTYKLGVSLVKWWKKLLNFIGNSSTDAEEISGMCHLMSSEEVFFTEVRTQCLGTIPCAVTVVGILYAKLL